jgi:hypothetical protein
LAGTQLVSPPSTTNSAPVLDRLKDIRLEEARHGRPGDRRFDYVPLYILRGLEALHIEFTANP